MHQAYQARGVIRDRLVPRDAMDIEDTTGIGIVAANAQAVVGVENVHLAVGPVTIATAVQKAPERDRRTSYL